MVKKALMLLGVLAIVGVAGLSLLLPDAVNASGHSATRSFITESVDTGAELEIEISVSGLGGFGQVQETLPDGFIFVDSEETANVDGQNVRFTILGNDATFRYTVLAPETPGTYVFSGSAVDTDRESEVVGGDSSIEVMGVETGPMAERSLSRSSINIDEQLTISVTASQYGTAASITEQLPDGLSFVSSSLGSASVNIGDGEVRFTLLGDESFTYTVTASEQGRYTLMGTITSFDRLSSAVGGDNIVIVNPPAPASASRSFGADYADAGGEVVVTIDVSGYGAAGQLEETLPDGFTYVGTDVLGGATEVSGQTFFLTLLGESSITYTVTAADTEGEYTFSGVLRDIDKNEVTVGGASEFRVGDPAPFFADPTNAVRSVPENTAPGVTIGGPVTAVSPLGPLAYEITSAAADTFDIDASSGQLLTKAPLDYETRQSYSLRVTATDVRGSEVSLVITVQVLDVFEPPEEEPTATPPAATATPSPTPPPPAPTATVPATAPPAPEPTATPTPTPTVEPEEEDEGGFPVWAIIVIVLAVVGGVAIIGFVAVRRRS